MKEESQYVRGRFHGLAEEMAKCIFELAQRLPETERESFFDSLNPLEKTDVTLDYFRSGMIAGRNELRQKLKIIIGQSRR